MCDCCRVVTLLCTTHKILENISYIKLVPCAEEIIWEYQGSFHRGRSTFEQIFTLRQILEKTWKQNIDVHNHLLIQIAYTYDSVCIKEICIEMHKLDFPKKLNCAEFWIMKYMLRLKLVNIHPLNLKLTKVWEISHLLFDIVLEMQFKSLKYCILSFGWFPGVWNLWTDVSENSICSISIDLVYRKKWECECKHNIALLPLLKSQLVLRAKKKIIICKTLIISIAKNESESWPLKRYY
jgi:hypothetical protein